MVAAAWCWKEEAVSPSLSLARIGDGFAGAVMVVTKFFSTEGRTAATLPVRPGVMAEVVLCFAGIFDPLDHLHCVFHVPTPPISFLCKVFKTGWMSVDLLSRSSSFRVKRRSPAVSRASVLSSLI